MCQEQTKIEIYKFDQLFRSSYSSSESGLYSDLPPVLNTLVLFKITAVRKSQRKNQVPK